MMNSRQIEFTKDILTEGVRVLHSLFINNLARDRDGAMVIDAHFPNQPKNKIEQIIFSCSLCIFLLQDKITFCSNYIEIESQLVKGIHQIIFDDESLDNCLDEDISYHNFIHLRYFQYKVLIERLLGTPAIDTKREIFNFLYYHPLEIGLVTFTNSKTVSFEEHTRTCIVFNSAIKSFNNAFLNIIKDLTYEIQHTIH